VRTGSILEFSDTRAQSPGWSLNIKANDLTSGTYIIDNSNIKLINNYNNLTHGPGHCFQSGFLAANPNNVVGNPYQTIQFPQNYFGTAGVNLDGERLMASGSAGRGCGGKFQNSFHIDVTVPGGTVPGTYSTTLVATAGNAP
jgi:hypothetical protein